MRRLNCTFTCRITTLGFGAAEAYKDLWSNGNHIQEARPFFYLPQVESDQMQHAKPQMIAQRETLRDTTWRRIGRTGPKEGSGVISIIRLPA
jgi:hypothetical protein